MALTSGGGMRLSKLVTTRSAAGKACDSVTRAALASAVDSTNSKSVSHTQFTAKAEDYNPDNKHGGGYWLFERTIGHSSPMTAASTYTKVCSSDLQSASWPECSHETRHSCGG